MFSFERFCKQYQTFFIIWGILPPLLAWIVVSIFSHHTPTQLPIAFIDEDQSSLSRDLRFFISSSPSLKVEKELYSLNDAKAHLSDAEIFAVVVIPEHFEANIKKGITQEIALYYNAQFVLIGKSIYSAFTELNAAFNAQNLVAQNLVKTSNIAQSFGYSVPIIPHINAFYNTNSNYAQFLITLILPCIWQTLVALGMLELLKPSIKNPIQILGMLTINTALSIFWGMLMIILFKALEFPILGHIHILLYALIIFSMAISGIVICIQALLKDRIKSISVVAVYTAPSLAFAGITYPQNSMPAFGEFWSHLLPISHFMRIYLEQSSYAAPIEQSIDKMIGMLPFGLFLCLGLMIFFKQYKQESKGLS